MKGRCEWGGRSGDEAIFDVLRKTVVVPNGDAKLVGTQKAKRGKPGSSAYSHPSSPRCSVHPREYSWYSGEGPNACPLPPPAPRKTTTSACLAMPPSSLSLGSTKVFPSATTQAPYTRIKKSSLAADPSTGSKPMSFSAMLGMSVLHGVAI